jgi:hypothetical protein
MNGNTSGSPGLSPLRRLGARASAAAAVAMLAAAALLATACGGGGGAGSSGSGGKTAYQKELAFSVCMRAHGMPNFPDPGSNGVISVHGGGAAKKEHSIGGPQMTRAQRACAHLLPNGGVPTAAQRQQMQRQGLKFAECMRAHGVSNFPDPPAGSGAGGPVKLNINPRSPGFQSAQRACQKLLGPGAGSLRIPG